MLTAYIIENTHDNRLSILILDESKSELYLPIDTLFNVIYTIHAEQKQELWNQLKEISKDKNLLECFGVEHFALYKVDIKYIGGLHNGNQE